MARPETPAIKFGAIQEYGFTNEQAQKLFLAEVNHSIERLRHFQGTAPGRVHIHKVDYPVYFGMDAIDIEFGRGTIFLRLYPIGAGDRPVVILRQGETRWFEFYKKQLFAITGQIHHASIEHVTAIDSLAQQQSSEFVFSFNRRSYENFVNKADYFIVLTLEEKVRGFLLAVNDNDVTKQDFEYEHLRPMRKRRFVLIRQTCVEERCRRTGYGRRLYDHLFNLISSHKHIESVFVFSLDQSEASTKFHEGLGWRKVTTFNVQGDKIASIWERNFPQ